MASITINERLVPVQQYVTPTTGSTVNVGTTGYIRLRINPAGSLLALTVTLPAAPTDGDVVEVASSQAITTLTMNGGTIIGALTSMVIGTFAVYEYSSGSTSWFRVG